MSGPSITLPAHAKVNLFLDVLRKRPDGTHELVTLFERIDLSDELTVRRTPGPGVTLESESREIPLDGTNLVVRAAEEYRQLSGWSDGVGIHLRKRIPVGGGLGGGSSDAAATLIALQQLSGQAVPRKKLIRCAQGLGADVAFFAADCARALGKGRGDEIEPLGAGPAFWYLLVTPDFQIPTKAIYGAWVPRGGNPEVAPILQALANGQAPQIRSFLYNALEPMVERLYPEIKWVKSEIETTGLEKPMVSGSGSTVFALCKSKEEAESAAKKLRSQQPAWRVWAVSTAL